MSNNAPKINNYNFIVPIPNGHDELIVYVPQPLEQELKGLARILGEIFAALRDGKIDRFVFLQDWDVYVDEICEKLENGEGKKKALDAFFERSLLGASIFNTDGDSIKELPDDCKHIFKGTLLFMSALYRYTFKAVIQDELRDSFTSLSAMEYQSSLRKSQDTSIQESGVVIENKK